jgi:hypothetical protein
MAIDSAGCFGPRRRPCLVAERIDFETATDRIICGILGLGASDMGSMVSLDLSAHDIACATPSLSLRQSLGDGSRIGDYERDTWRGGASMVRESVDMAGTSAGV